MSFSIKHSGLGFGYWHNMQFIFYLKFICLFNKNIRYTYPHLQLKINLDLLSILCTHIKNTVFTNPLIPTMDMDETFSSTSKSNNRDGIVFIFSPFNFFLGKRMDGIISRNYFINFRVICLRLGWCEEWHCVTMNILSDSGLLNISIDTPCWIC